MGLSALKCDGYASSAEADTGEGRLTTSDFSGKEVLTVVAITGTLAAVSGCISYSSQDNNDNGGGAVVSEPKDSGGGKPRDRQRQRPSTAAPK